MWLFPCRAHSSVGQPDHALGSRLGCRTDHHQNQKNPDTQGDPRKHAVGVHDVLVGETHIDGLVMRSAQVGG